MQIANQASFFIELFNFIAINTNILTAVYSKDGIGISLLIFDL